MPAAYRNPRPRAQMESAAHVLFGQIMSRCGDLPVAYAAPAQSYAQPTVTYAATQQAVYKQAPVACSQPQYYEQVPVTYAAAPRSWYVQPQVTRTASQQQLCTSSRR